MSAKAELHNKVSADALKAIVKPVIESGGSWSEVLVVLESVNVGVLLAVAEMEKWSADHTQAYERAMSTAVRHRLQDLQKAKAP